MTPLSASTWFAHLGPLTGNGMTTPVGGCYSFRHIGRAEPLAPDLRTEDHGAVSSISFHAGVLTRGARDAEVAWSRKALSDKALEIVIAFDAPQFVSQVALRQNLEQPSLPPDKPRSLLSSEAGNTPSGQDIEEVRTTYMAGIGSIQVLARPSADAPLALVGRLGEAGQITPLLQEMLAIDVGVEACQVVIRLESNFRHIRLNALEVWGAPLGQPRLYPPPRQMTLDPAAGAFRLAQLQSILIGAEASEDTLFAARLFAEKTTETYGTELTVRQMDAHDDLTGALMLGKPAEIDGETVPAGDVNDDEAFTLRIRSDGIQLLSPGRRGLIYGVEALLQLFSRDSAEPAVPCGVVTDFPALPMRGVLILLPARDQIDFFKRLVRYLLAPMRINWILMEVTAGMQFERRPEINEKVSRQNRLAAEGKAPQVPFGSNVAGGACLTKDEVRDLVDYARQYGIDVIPEVQSLSHVEYLTITYPDIAESQTPGWAGYPDCYCPQNERAFEVVRDLIDEVVEVFRPRQYVHIGHDEAYTMCACERCRGLDKARLFADDVNRIYSHIAAKGLKVMMWDDMVNTTRHFACPAALDMIPKDIVLMNFVWYDRVEMDTEDILLDHGFPVLFGNFYSSSFPRYHRRAAKNGILGGVVSFWAGLPEFKCDTSEDRLGHCGKFYDLMYSAHMLWSGEHQPKLRRYWSRVIAGMVAPLRDRLAGDVYPSRRRGASFVPLELPGQVPRLDATGAKGSFDLTTLPQGRGRLLGVPFELGSHLAIVEPKDVIDARFPSQVQIAVDAVADSVILLHACTAKTTLPNAVARYELLYEDGALAAVEVLYGWQLAEISRAYGAPLTNAYHRHHGYIATYPALPFWQGKTATGQDATLYGFEWRNPHPHKRIRALLLKASEQANSAAVIVAAVTLIRSATV